MPDPSALFRVPLVALLTVLRLLARVVTPRPAPLAIRVRANDRRDLGRR